MFDYAFTEPKRNAKPRCLTATVSFVVHALIIGFAVGLPILYASDALPEPPDMMAFVMDAPAPPPPPPPAPPPPASKTPEPAKPNAAEVPVEKPAPPPATVAAPAEAPSEVKPETGNEGAVATGKPAVEAGFEKGVTGGVEGGVAGGVVSAALPPPPPPPKPKGPVRVGGQVKAPSLVHRVNPQYPPVAQTAQVEGTVVLEATVNKTGRVESVRVVTGNPLLDPAAIAAVKQWRYEPLTLNGEPVPFILTVTVSFSVPR
jgi:protein TonB